MSAKTVIAVCITNWIAITTNVTSSWQRAGMKTAPVLYYHYLKTDIMANDKDKLVASDRYMKQKKTDAYAVLIRDALEVADLYKPEKEPAIYMLATLLELYQKTRAAIDKDGLTVENSTKTTIKTVANPAVAMNLSYAKAIQNYLQQLGLAAAIARAGGADSGGGGDMADNPLNQLREAIENNRTPVILKLNNAG